MAKKKTTKNKTAADRGRNEESEIRLKVTNWDTEVTVMTNKRSSRPSNRKVLTKGIISGEDLNALTAAEDAAVLTRVLDFVRAGYEYRMVDENGEEALRFIPIVERDMKTVTLVAQTMGSFRGSLNDKEVKPFYRGEEVTRKKAKDMGDKELEHQREWSKTRLNVSPDTLVTCPKCGTEFRVGKELV